MIMSNLERKIKRNKIRNQYGNKEIKKEFRLFQIYKYGIGNYAKMQNKSIKNVLGEDV